MNENNIVRFSQAVQLVNETDKITHYQEKINIVIMTYAKNTLLQFMRFDLYDRVLELSFVLSDGDVSNFLFSELDKVLNEFEELQNDVIFKDIQKMMQVTVNKYNEKLREEEQEKLNQK